MLSIYLHMYRFTEDFLAAWPLQPKLFPRNFLKQQTLAQCLFAPYMQISSRRNRTLIRTLPSYSSKPITRLHQIHISHFLFLSLDASAFFITNTHMFVYTYLLACINVRACNIFCIKNGCQETKLNLTFLIHCLLRVQSI